jgi:hypothetical protein
MNVAVKHQGTTITGRVVSYNREHRICTGIGTLELVLEGTYATTISPHHTIDIWENGSFQVRYYVSDVSRNVPDNTITVQCQDKSKYLVDYFIPTSYTIDYPSYTRYWIEKFLDEMGVTYQFTTASQGNLLSNYTQLGLQSGYDQIMMLLQLSGWYMYFDGNGKAIIGALTTDLASSAGSVGKTDILDIKKVTDDKMLRNRAVVWGQYDGFTGQYAFADVSVHTRENYDHNDLRAMVISNSNIPDKNSAYGIANQLIKEFARPTIEKHLIVWGARNFNLGEALKVDSHIWRGKGLITTFGVSLDKSGLVTNIVLDERCPRLFGFFDFGDYVYVATYGEGIWRKHIKFDPTWYNFSTGLTDLAITDMHIKDAIYGAVGTSGIPFYANTEAGPWHPITITGLQSSLEDAVLSGGTIVYESFSGIMARATIVDKETGNVKFGVDTWSGLNLGDYFLNYSGMTTAMSGVSISGGHRGWILEYDPFTGTLVGGLGSGIYPISISGNYNIKVLDLENDGHNDYVSVATSSNGIFGNSVLQEYNYGYGGVSELRTNTKISMSTLGNTPSSLSISQSSDTNKLMAFGLIDNENEHELFYVNFNTFTSTGSFNIKKYATTNSSFSLIHNTLVNLTVGKVPVEFSRFTGKAQVIKVDTDKYRFLLFSGSSVELCTVTHLGSESYSVSYSTLATAGDTVGGDTLAILDVVQNDKQAIIVCISRSLFDETVDQHYYYKVVNLEAGSAASYTLVYSSGASSGAHKLSQIRLYAYDDGFQTIGFQTEGNSNPRDIYSISGTGLGVNKGAFIASRSVSLPLALSGPYSTRLSRLWSSLATSIGGGDYINYGVNGVENYTAQDFVSGNIINSPFDNKVFRVRPSTVTLSGLPELQVCTLPLSNGWTTINLGAYKPRTNVFFRLDSIENRIYIFGTHTITDISYLLGLNSSTYAIESSITINESSTSATSPGGVRPYNVGNFVMITDSAGSNSQGFEFRVYRNLTPALGDSGGYLVLQRDGSDFHIIEQEAYPIRIDISNYSPLLDVGSGNSSFVSNYIYDSELVAISPVPFNGQQVNDYRYTFLEPSVSGVVTSGMAGMSTGLYITSSGIYGFDVASYSGGFSLEYEIPSGIGTRIETTNYGLNGQYLFMTTMAGTQQDFYQKDPDGFAFALYSGLVQSRCTIIRCDDRM